MSQKKQYNPFDVPEKPPNLNVTVDRLYPDGKVKLLIVNNDNNKSTYKTYDTMDEAQRLAAFTACTLRVGHQGSAALDSWLKARGFPGIPKEDKQAFDKQLQEAYESRDRKDKVFEVVERHD